MTIIKTSGNRAAYFSDGAGFALQQEASKWAYETADAMLEARK